MTSDTAGLEAASPYGSPRTALERWPICKSQDSTGTKFGGFMEELAFTLSLGWSSSLARKSGEARFRAPLSAAVLHTQ